MESDLFDEFGNYIGAELAPESDGEIENYYGRAVGEDNTSSHVSDRMSEERKRPEQSEINAEGNNIKSAALPAIKSTINSPE